VVPIESHGEGALSVGRIVKKNIFVWKKNEKEK